MEIKATEGMARRKAEMWRTGCVPFSVRGRTGEPKVSRWGEEVTEGKNQSGGWKGQGKLSEPTAVTGYF